MADSADLAGELIAWQEEMRRQQLVVVAGCSGSGTGDCDECGEEIPEARRRAVPGCRLCVECQTLMEWRR